MTSPGKRWGPFSLIVVVLAVAAILVSMALPSDERRPEWARWVVEPLDSTSRSFYSESRPRFKREAIQLSNPDGRYWVVLNRYNWRVSRCD